MVTKGTVAVVLALSLIVSVAVVAQPTTYEEFFGDFIMKRANQIRDDANQLEALLDSWSNGEISQSTVVAKLEEMETRADGYFADVLRLPSPEGKFKKYQQSIFIFVTWSNIIGIFTDGMTDLDLAKLDAASTLSDYFDKKVNAFEERLDQNEG